MRNYWISHDIGVKKIVISGLTKERGLVSNPFEIPEVLYFRSKGKPEVTQSLLKTKIHFQTCSNPDWIKGSASSLAFSKGPKKIPSEVR